MEITQESIRAHIFDMADADFKTFHSRLVPGNDTIAGVRVPVLRQYAKELLKEADAPMLLKIIGSDCYEERMLKGMIIGLWPGAALADVLQQAEQFLPEIDNWAVCDTFCAGLKITKKHKQEVYEWLMQFVSAKEAFTRRFVLVMLLDYYIEEMYIEQMFDIIEKINKDEYYVQMAAAWAVSVALVKMYDRTILYLDRCHLDDFTYNKALQKAVESYRISKEQKQELRSRMRKKDHRGR